MADFEAPWTSIVSLALSSPRPSSRTPSLARRSTPDFTSDSALMVPLASSSLASIASWRRSRLISANSTRKMLLKPRLGNRRCSGIWPPSKPLMRTPERAVWPLPSRPAVLPLPEPMPRPTRMRFLREPALSAISLSFIALSPYVYVSLFLVDDADEMLNLRDHAANCGCVRKLGDAADLVELEPDQRRALRVMAADRAAGLLDLDHLCGLGHRHNSEEAPEKARVVYSATASASPPTRRACSVDTLMLRRAATERGES